MIKMIAPYPNVMLKNNTVAASGTYNDQNVSSTADLLFTAYDQADSGSPKTVISNSASNPADWNILSSDANGNGTWFFKNTFAAGKHILTIEIKEQKTPANLSQAATNFTVTSSSGTVPTGGTAPATTGGNSTGSVNPVKQANGASPYIASSKIVFPDNRELNAEDLTGVPKDAQIKITIADDKPMTQFIGKVQAKTNPYNPVQIFLGQSHISGTDTITSTTQSGKYLYSIIFKPSKPLTLNSTYLVYIDPNLLDNANNPIYSRFFKFTTASDMDKADNPHGNYTLTTNMCANCHSTHNGTDSSLQGGTYQVQFNNQLKKDPAENYCMACHDGTLNAPIVDKINDKFQHNKPANVSPAAANALKQTNSCTSCHNPHLSWSASNPNMLTDHYVYTHKETVPSKGLVSATVDSLNTTCDTCHDNNAIYSQSSSTAKYETLAYKKSFTATGVIADYTLCLRCHNADTHTKDSQVSDIQTYYSDPTSRHNFKLPFGQTTQANGSALNGQIPCAECHETHGSNNIYGLREQLGNAKPTGSDQFKTTGTVWTSSTDRTFCLKCHNNKTEIYGKTGVFQTTTSGGKPITGHQAADPQACSTCHGGKSKSFTEAAHAPKLSSK